MAQILARRRMTSFSLDAIPRISRAQSMDTLSSMATVAGYRAVLLAAQHLPEIPAHVDHCGGDHSSRARADSWAQAWPGLQAIATARRLGAVVEAFDVRPAVKEQVKSLGRGIRRNSRRRKTWRTRADTRGEVSAETLARQQKLLHERAKVADFIISTAQVPGKPAPRLITREMVADMKPGSVMVDLAAESGGNCELTKAGEIVRSNGVTILGPTNLPAHTAAGRQPDVRPQPGQFHPGNHQRERVHDGLEERNFRRNLRHLQRGDQPKEEDRVTWAR